MQTSKKSYEYCYNGQIAVDAQMIVAADLTNQAGDAPHLPDLVDRTISNTRRYPQQVSADAGYYSESNLDHLEDVSTDRPPIEAFIPPDEIRHNEWRDGKPPLGQLPKNPSRKYLIRRKLQSKGGREINVLRQTTVEPVFGQIKASPDDLLPRTRHAKSRLMGHGDLIGNTREVSVA